MLLMLQVIWFKRDLRVHDHAPLVEAATLGPTLPLYIIEPEYWQLPDSSERHLSWVLSSLRELRRSLMSLGQPLVVRTGEACAVLADIRERFGNFTLHAHEETGNAWTFKRDKHVRRWCRAHGISFFEYPQFGVVRGLRQRDGWNRRWEEFMGKPQLPIPHQLQPVAIELGDIPSSADLNSTSDSALGLQAGEAAATQTLTSFLSSRGQHYSKQMSSPLSASRSCSRLSPYIAWGNISLRHVVQQARNAKVEKAHIPAWQQSLASFDSRLHWHCHFIQKLEDEPTIESHCFIRSFDDMRQPYYSSENIRRFLAGETGYPFIDACIRSLATLGWINFRMRAMLVSFAAYDLLIDWRDISHTLASWFIDYEPGIHYSQLQMQSGTSGINAIRIYDPVKQGFDQDPQARFIRQWVPELRNVPPAFALQPWKLPLVERRSVRYPIPIVDHQQAVTKARALLTKYRNLPNVKAEAEMVLKRHGSRKSGIRQISRPRKIATRQLSLL